MRTTFLDQNEYHFDREKFAKHLGFQFLKANPTLMNSRKTFKNKNRFKF